MKKTFKFATVALATTLCATAGILFGAKSFAHASSVGIEDMKAYLASIHIPDVYLKLASDEEIEQTYYAYNGKDDIVVESSVSYLTESKGNAVSPLDIISKDEMSFTVTAIPQCIKSDGVIRIKCVEVMVSYEWTKLPSYRKLDSIIVNWDPNVFTFSNGTFYQFDTRIVGPASNPQEQHNVIQRPSELTQGGLGYEFDLKPDSGTCIGILGYARFNLMPKQNPMYPADGNASSQTTSVNAQYSHLWYWFRPSVGFTVNNGSISFTYEDGTDTTSTGCNVRYSY